MILYARLVMDSLSFLSNLQDIREELTTLPAGLDQAYVISRDGALIAAHRSYQLRPYLKAHQRTTHRDRTQTSKKNFRLGWLLEASDAEARTRSCACDPTRRQKIYQKSEGIPEHPATVRAYSRNRKRYCAVCSFYCETVSSLAPVTFKRKLMSSRYLFGPQTDEFLKRLDSHLDISKACVRYLAFDCFEIHEPEEIEASIFSGDYVLLNYAATQWLDQLKNCAEVLDNSDETDDLCQEVEDLVEKRLNLDYEGPLTYQKRLATEFKAFRKDWPQLCETLNLENSFWIFKAPLLSLNNGTP